MNPLSTLTSISQARDLLFNTLLTLTLFNLAGTADAQDRSAIPTFSRDIAPILQQKCQTCHNPEGIGPMPLISYRQVQPFAPLIKDRVTRGIMPPGIWTKLPASSATRMISLSVTRKSPPLLTGLMPAARRGILRTCQRR